MGRYTSLKDDAISVILLRECCIGGVKIVCANNNKDRDRDRYCLPTERDGLLHTNDLYNNNINNNNNLISSSASIGAIEEEEDSEDSVTMCIDENILMTYDFNRAVNDVEWSVCVCGVC
eukprot:GHVR01053812.1.p1 GENE.GHVR01053812.1~~GHVR01053812.1.p1  ORF type:complete len:119 (+),score=46.78 GHVR01053812.1:215-571(+)